jgi:hypothetical protein
LEQWLVRIVYEDAGLEPENEECWCFTRSDAIEVAAALFADYPDAHIEVQEGTERPVDRWVVEICYREERESCAFLTADGAREYAESLASDYAYTTAHSPAREITITGPHGWVNYILGDKLALAG